MIRPCERCGMVHTKANAIAVWAKHGWGRLYWERNNRHWKSWDGYTIARAIDGNRKQDFRESGDIIHVALGID